MRKYLIGFVGLLVLSVLCSVPSAFGQVNLVLNDAGNNVMDGIYVGPYNVAVGGTPSQLICDDFGHETSQGESWLANVTTISNLAGTTWAGQTAGGNLLGNTGSTLQGYEAMMYLASQMLGNGNATQVGYLSYAIWSIFDSSGVYNWLVNHNDSAAWSQVQSLAAGALKTAVNGGFSIAQFSGWEIFTPTVCLNNCGNGLPQEFLEYVPEGGAAMGYLLLGLVSCAAAALYRRQQLQA
jgi:hypothetical protein